MRLWCHKCGIVRDVVDLGAPWWCRHGDPTGPTPAVKMSAIPPVHPLATGPLPWVEAGS